MYNIQRAMKIGRVLAEGLHMREAPNTSAPTLKMLPWGQQVTILESLTGGPYNFNEEQMTLWLHIREDDTIGYVAAAYTSTGETRKELRGVWIPDVTFLNTLASSESINEALDYLQGLGFNAVFPAVWNRGLTAFPSSVMEEHGFARQDPLYQGFDPLEIIVTEGKRRGLAVIPWFEYGFASSPEPDGGPILRAKPEWGARNLNGELTRHGNLTWMNSLHPEVQEFLLMLVLEAIQLYDLDGIQGDDRWPAMPFNSGYDSLSREMYRNAKGQYPPSEEKDATWVKFRSGKMTEYLKQIRKEIKNAKPGCIVSMAPAPFPFGLRELMQDSNQWMQESLVDVLIPQLYRSSFTSYRKDLDTLVLSWNSNIRSHCAPGIAMKANNIDLTGSDIENMILRNRDLGMGGHAFFHFGSLRGAVDEVSLALRRENVFGNKAELPPFLLV
jgi:uncharacterized lipoprotein YddW (UPF0748 family)